METKEKRKKLVAGVLTLAGLLLVWTLATAGNLEPSAPPGSTMKTLNEVEPRIPIHASDLPLIITEPNSYYLVEDVNFTDTAHHAITIECDDVTIDLMGYILKGPDSGTKCGIYMNGRKNVEIRNGTIRDFGSALSESSTSSRSHRVINIRALSNGWGISLYGRGNLIKDCTAAANGGWGIDASSGSTVTGNTCYDNSGCGINTGYSTVTGNACYDNGDDGIYAHHGSTVTGNTCYSNDDNGIQTDSGCTVTGNTCYDNASYGIYASEYCLVDQNAAYYNGTNMYTGTGCQVGLNVAPP